MQIEACANQQVMNADIIVITASVAIEGKVLTSRMQMEEKNAAMFRELVPVLAANNPNAVLIFSPIPWT
jgi:L-lactate dehydrogenase